MVTRRPTYSIRMGTNPNAKGFPLDKIREMFLSVHEELRRDGYFDEFLGSYCVDDGFIPGKVASPHMDIVVRVRKDNLWPIAERGAYYSEDDLFDMVEYLFAVVSKPLTGDYHSYSDCGMHWKTFNKRQGEEHFRAKINGILDLYEKRFELSKDGEILHKPDRGFEQIFEASAPISDEKVLSRVDAAVLRYRRHGATPDDRRQAVRDLADVLEYLRPQIKTHLSRKDESDLFNIANNFGIRHHNSGQKTDYDASLWLSWIFYLYLSTIHLVLRKVAKSKS